MKILAGKLPNRINYESIFDVVRTTRTKSSAISLFPHRAEKKRLLAEANELAKKEKEIKQNAYALTNDFKIAKDDLRAYLNRAENIKMFSKYEYISAKKIIDETGNLTKNERKKKTVKGIKYVREKKKKFAGGIEINDYTNGTLTRKIYKTRDKITVTAIDQRGKTSIFSFNTNGEIETYIEDIQETNNGFSANEKFIFSNGILESVEEGFQYTNNNESAKKKYILSDGKIYKFYRNFCKSLDEEEPQIKASEFFQFHKDFPYIYHKEYEYYSNEEESSTIKHKYETTDYISNLKESTIIEKQPNGTEKSLLYRFKKKKLSAIYIQDRTTKQLRYFTFDIEGKPLNYYEDTISS